MPLTGYFRLAQDGIEPLKENIFMEKDKESSHYYFDYFRVAMQYCLNQIERVSGMGILAFAPNGRIWLQTSEYCYELGELASYYYALDLVLDEAEKSKAKTVEIMFPNEKVVEFVNSYNPDQFIKRMKWASKEIKEAYKQLHSHAKERFSKFGKVIITFRKDYPKDVQARLDKESSEAAQPPQVDPFGHWNSSSGGKSYFNVGQTEEDMKQFAEQLARIHIDFMESYGKEYEQDYGKEAMRKLIADVKEGKIKKLPPTKRVLREKRETIILKETKTPFKKHIVCHNCGSEMVFESATLEKPENEKRYLMRCKHCLATKTLDERGRLKLYGRYPKPKTE